MTENLAERKPENNSTPANTSGNGSAGSNYTTTGSLPTRFTARQLAAMDLPEPRYAVQGLLPEGLGVLAGNPKIGKSWLVIQLCLAVAHGSRAFGQYDVVQGRVLYLALEDNARRLQSRLKMMGETDPPDDLEIHTQWKGFPPGLAELERWIKQNPNAGLIVIDTWTKVKPPRTGNNDAYHSDSQQLSEVHKLAQTYGVTVLLVHHLNKGASVQEGDWIEQISGSMGMSGTPDTLWHISRPRGDSKGTWRLVGRDIDEQELAATFDSECGKWTVEGDKDDVPSTGQEDETIKALREQGPCTPAELATLMNEDRETIKKRCQRMCNRGKIERRDGRYAARGG